jgi:hypothetical protein
MVALLLAIAALGGFLLGSRVGRHRWHAELLRAETLLQTQVLPYLARRAADLGLKTAALPPEPGSAGLQAATLCAMLSAKEQAQARAAPEDLADTLRDRK